MAPAAPAQPRPLRDPSLPCRGRSPSSPPQPTPPPPVRPPARPRAVVTRVRLVPLQLLPKRLDWEGNEHNRSYEELVRFLTFPSPCFRAPAPRPLVGAPTPGVKWLSGARGRPRDSGTPSAGLVLFWGGRVCFGRKRPWWVGGVAGGRWGRPCAAVCGGVGPQVRLPLLRAGGARARGLGGGGLQPLNELLSSFCFRTRLVTRPLIGLHSFAPPSSSNHLFPRNRIVGV